MLGTVTNRKVNETASACNWKIMVSTGPWHGRYRKIQVLVPQPLLVSPARGSLARGSEEAIAQTCTLFPRDVSIHWLVYGEIQRPSHYVWKFLKAIPRKTELLTITCVATTPVKLCFPHSFRVFFFFFPSNRTYKLTYCIYTSIFVSWETNLKQV